ncbi:hypothetical protein UY3_05532 [Chelonia mydas]|uniref:Uncharacterized protein n=1 Tax=Chelonia mydas TaxID=8469 RepID=M7BNK3_CHEMY|nr:hypothetical protein UY3_05532 [Chelonia mydas]
MEEYRCNSQVQFPEKHTQYESDYNGARIIIYFSMPIFLQSFPDPPGKLRSGSKRLNADYVCKAQLLKSVTVSRIYPLTFNFPFCCDSQNWVVQRVMSASQVSSSEGSALPTAVQNCCHCGLKGSLSTLMECLSQLRRRKKRTQDDDMFNKNLQPSVTFGHEQSFWQMKISDCMGQPGEGKRGEEKGPGVPAGKGKGEAPGHNGVSPAANTAAADSGGLTGSTIMGLSPFEVPGELHFSTCHGSFPTLNSRVQMWGPA